MTADRTKPSARLFVALVMRYVEEGREEMALQALRGGTTLEECQELLDRLDGRDEPAALSVASALRAASERRRLSRSGGT